jgi:uncharacterized protein
MGSTSYHERHADLSEETRNLHRAIASLMEELEAVDWYQQRVDATDDPALKEILAHNRDEEIEHAAMVLEWLRRNNSVFDEQLRRYLFTARPIVAVEHAAEQQEAGDESERSSRAAPLDGRSGSGASLGIGALKHGGRGGGSSGPS